MKPTRFAVIWRQSRPHVAAALALLTVVLAACATPTQAPTQPPAPTAEPTAAGPYHPADARTGVEPVDRVIEAVLSGDRAQMASLVHYTVTGCTQAEGLGGPPKCAEGQAEGAEVEVFPVMGPGEGSYATRESIEGVFPEGDYALFAAFTVPDDLVPEGDYWPVGDYGVMFVERGTGAAMTLLVTEDGIVRVVSGPTAETLLAHREVGGFILAPVGG
jgi:hypothetical protein